MVPHSSVGRALRPYITISQIATYNHVCRIFLSVKLKIQMPIARSSVCTNYICGVTTVTVFVCLFDCLFVCLATILKKCSSDPHKTDLREGEKNLLQSNVLTVTQKVCPKLNLRHEVLVPSDSKKIFSFIQYPMQRYKEESQQNWCNN